MKRYMILSLIALVSLSQTTFAQVYTWAGGQGGNAWNDANNWSPKGVPETGDSAIVKAPPYQGPIINEGNIVCFELNGPGDSKGANLMQITGGTVHFEDRWRIPQTYGCGPGIVEISGGTISIGRYLFIGYRGTAVVTMRDGVFNLGADIDMGRDWQDESNHGNGTWNLEGGTINLGTKMRVGNHGEAVLNMSGGSLTIPQYLRIGDVATGYGVANISGGTLTINASAGEGLIVGRSGTGYLNITGGTINVGREICTSFETGSYSEVVMEDGYVSAASYLSVGAGGDGTFIMNGGEIVIGEHLTVGDTGTGHFEFNGGTILCGSPDTVNLRINNNSSMNIAGGTLIIRGYAKDYVEELANSGRLLAYDARGWINTDYNELEDQTMVTAGGGKEYAGVIAPRTGAYGIDFHGTVLQWIPGTKAAECVLYFGGDYDLVAAGDASVYMGRFTADVNSYNLNDLALDTTYYWRVDSSKDGDPNSPWTGNVWSFTTHSSVLVDDMESYGEEIVVGEPGDRIWYTWRDGAGWTAPTPGYGGNGTGSMVDISTDINHGDQQALAFTYDNDGTNALDMAGLKYYSEITVDTANLAIGALGSDWTRATKAGAMTLTLYFYGDIHNAVEQMYVKFNDVKVVYGGDAAAITKPWWTQWDIDLASLGENLKNVTNIAIGIGDEASTSPGGSGVLYIDDIRLYQSPPKIPQEEIWLDAEAADVLGTSWRLYDDPEALGGRYIGSDNGDGNSNDSPPGAEWIADYNFTVTGGVYKVMLRVKIDSDSFWVRIPDATSLTPGDNPNNPGWVFLNRMEPGETWHWVEVRSDDHNLEVANWTLPAGPHTLKIGKREDGVWLDAIVVVKLD